MLAFTDISPNTALVTVVFGLLALVAYQSRSYDKLAHDVVDRVLTFVSTAAQRLEGLESSVDEVKSTVKKCGQQQPKQGENVP
jgi:hypothetical protein